jgi:transmembrane sensor
MNHEEFKEILQRYQSGNASGREMAFVDAYYAAFEARPDIMEHLSAEEQEKLEQLLYKNLKDQFPAVIKPAHRVHFLKTAWFKSAAAIIILITGIAIYFFIHTSQSQVEMAEKSSSPLPKEDVLPGSDRAILTLSNGQQVQLNNATSETIKDGTLSIENINGQLSYAENGKPHSPFEKGGRSDSQAGGTAGGFNTMTTPNGGQYKLTLSDGTNVWLNAASSITYPISFKGATREVSITGECYFEIKKNPSKPFIVKTPAEDITVLGTEFNVNAYPDEPSMKTSLLEGVVKIGDTFIKPGQAYQDGKIKQTNVQQDLAWKNGVFNFNNLTVEQAMRQISRWYNVEVIYKSRAPEIRFFGSINRSAPLSTVLLALNQAGVKFKVEKNKLIVE